MPFCCCIATGGQHLMERTGPRPVQTGEICTPALLELPHATSLHALKHDINAVRVSISLQVVGQSKLRCQVLRSPYRNAPERSDQALLLNYVGAGWSQLHAL
jgi:hypothetical protein